MLSLAAPSTCRPAASHDEIGLLSWIPIALFSVAAASLFLAAGFRMDPADAGRNAALLIAGGAASALLARRREGRKVGILFMALMQTIIIANAAMMITYAAAACNRPLVDAILLRLDRSMGYDWQAYVRLFEGEGLLARIILSSYDSIFVQPIILIALLTMTGQTRRLELFVLATMLALIATAFLFALFPATTAWVHLGIPEAELARFKHLPVASTGWIHDLLEVRRGAMRHVDPTQGSGLTAFPSYHTTAALLNIWAAWRLRGIRPLFMILNAAMIASTPLSGGHYVVDLLAGAVVMVSGIACASRLHARLLSWRRVRLPECAGVLPPAIRVT